MTTAYIDSLVYSTRVGPSFLGIMVIGILLLAHPAEPFSTLQVAMRSVDMAFPTRSQRLYYQENGELLPDRVNDPTLDRTRNNNMSKDVLVLKDETTTTKVRVHSPQQPQQRKYSTFLWHYQGHAYNINYRVEGPVNGPPLLLIHGFGANVGHFRHQYPTLTNAGYRVYAIDLLGFGASDKPAKVAYSIELFTELLTDFTVAMDDELASSSSSPFAPKTKKQWVIAGNSIGGLCSLAVAAKLKDLVRGVVLFNSSAGMTAFRHEDIPPVLRPILFFFRHVMLGPRIGSYFFTNFKTRQNVESILKFQGVYRDASKVDDELMEILLEPGNDEGAETVFLKVMGGPPGPTPESILPQLECPVLAIWGGADPWTPPDRGMHPATEYHHHVNQEKSAFDLIVLPNVGHCPHDEAPEVVNELMINWIQSLPHT